MNNGTVYIEMSWVALWLWGDRSAGNPCHGFVDDKGGALRAFTYYPDPHWPSPWVSPRDVQPGDTIELRLEAENPADLRRMREKIRGIAKGVDAA